jgi:hypothetical protein
MFTPPSFGSYDHNELFGDPQKRSSEVSQLEHQYRLEAPLMGRRLMLTHDHTYNSLCDCPRCSQIREKLRRY